MTWKSSILMCRRNFDIHSTGWVELNILVSTLNFDVVLMLIKWNCFDVEIQLTISSTLIWRLQFLKHYKIRPKIFLWSNQNQRCFNVKFHVDLTLINWRCFDVEIRLSFQFYIKILIFQALRYKSKIVF